MTTYLFMFLGSFQNSCHKACSGSTCSGWFIVDSKIWLVITRLNIRVLSAFLFLLGLILNWKIELRKRKRFWYRRFYELVEAWFLYILTAWVLAIIFFFSRLGHCSKMVRNSFVSSSNKFRVVIESMLQLGSRTCINHSFFSRLRGIL